MEYAPVIFDLQPDVADHGQAGNILGDVFRNIEDSCCPLVKFLADAAHELGSPS
ncbi:hypothetical protein D3C80_2233150 [compost metagenome]